MKEVAGTNLLHTAPNESPRGERSVLATPKIIAHVSKNDFFRRRLKLIQR